MALDKARLERLCQNNQLPLRMKVIASGICKMCSFNENVLFLVLWDSLWRVAFSRSRPVHARSTLNPNAWRPRLLYWWSFRSALIKMEAPHG